MRPADVLSIVLLLACTSACASDSQSVAGPTRATEPPSTAYDIYRTVVTQRGRGAGDGLLVVQEETATVQFCRDIGRGVGDEWRTALDSFALENGAGGRIAAGQNLGVPYVVVPRGRIDEIFAAAGRDLNRGWHLFGEAYPNGLLVSFSAVGFNPERTRAVVHMSTSCGSLCGEWRDYYVEWRNGLWVVTPAVSCWAVS